MSIRCALQPRDRKHTYVTSWPMLLPSGFCAGGKFFTPTGEIDLVVAAEATRRDYLRASRHSEQWQTIISANTHRIPVFADRTALPRCRAAGSLGIPSRLSAQSRLMARTAYSGIQARLNAFAARAGARS